MSKVSRCICHDRSFEQIKKFAAENGFNSVEELQKANYCSNSCRLCVPYVNYMLRTGETEIDSRAPYRNSK